MKKLFLLIMTLTLVSCTSPDYMEHKKIVITKIPKVPKAPEVQKNIISLNLDAGANFDSDKAILKNKDIPKLNEFIEKIKGLKGSLTITGHTDTTSTYAHNDKLSVRRALAVKNYMNDKLDLSNYDLSVIGKGEREPIYKNEKSEFEKAANRRVEIVFKESK